MTDEFFAPQRTSAFFNAKYEGFCAYPECHKHGDIELGDGCEYLDGTLMHMRCARAAQRETAK